MNLLLQPSELARWQGNKNLVLLDARCSPEGRRRYEQGHLPGALFVDVETELSCKSADPSEGGRHPLPSPAAFAMVLQSLGITPESTVLVYDDKSGANAACRFWWMLTAVGHRSVHVLDGGYQNACELGMTIQLGPVAATPAANLYPVTEWQFPTASVEQTRQASESDRATIIDVRESFRYRGESEPIDLVAGHIPNAVNIPYSENLDRQGRFLPPDLLADRYQSFFGPVSAEKAADDSVTGTSPPTSSFPIVHCGSGVSACHTLFALELAGLSGGKLYVGSWSEWSRRGLPQARS